MNQTGFSGCQMFQHPFMLEKGKHLQLPWAFQRVTVPELWVGLGMAASLFSRHSWRARCPPYKWQEPPRVAHPSYSNYRGRFPKNQDGVVVTGMVTSF